MTERVILPPDVLVGIAFYSGLTEAPKARAPYERFIQTYQRLYPELLGAFAFNSRGESDEVYRALDMLQPRIFENPDLFSKTVGFGEMVKRAKEKYLDPCMTPEIERQFKELGEVFREEFGKKEK